MEEDLQLWKKNEKEKHNFSFCGIYNYLYLIPKSVSFN